MLVGLDAEQQPCIEPFMRLMHPGPLLTALVLLGATSSPVAPQTQSAPRPSTEVQVPAPQLPPLPSDPNAYVRQAIAHELVVQDQDQTMWRYHLHREDEKNNFDKDVVQTHQGQLSRTLLMWGKPLNAQEQQNDKERMKRQVQDAEEQARREKREKEDGTKAREMLRLIPDAFFFKYAGEEKGLVRLSFVPNPRFDPPNFEAKVYKSLQGTLWIDRESMRLAGIDGILFEDVNFGWGLLGHLNKGGTFSVKQKDLGDGHWDVVSEEVDMNGRAVVFKTITRKQKQTRTEWRRVPDNITMQQAYQMLINDSNSSAHNQDTPALH